MGDGETFEGSVWEAAAFASFYKLDNVVGIVDVNRLGQSAETSLQHDINTFVSRWKSFGWHVIACDGHNVVEIIKALEESKTIKGQPTCIILKTFKGKDFTNVIEDKLDWHGKPVTLKNSEIIRGELRKMMKNENITLSTFEPTIKATFVRDLDTPGFKINPNYKIGEKVSTRVPYGTALKKLGEQDHHNHIVAFDGDVKNSTFAEVFEKEYPHKFANCFIGEQNMVSVAMGAGSRNKIAFCSTFACFFSRAFDQIRMGAISFANTKFFGSHSGIHIGEDGPSQMGLEVRIY